MNLYVLLYKIHSGNKGEDRHYFDINAVSEILISPITILNMPIKRKVNTLYK